MDFKFQNLIFCYATVRLSLPYEDTFSSATQFFDITCSQALLAQQRKRLLASVAAVINFIVNFISGNHC